MNYLQARRAVSVFKDYPEKVVALYDWSTCLPHSTLGMSGWSADLRI
jgi:hypothetical protein